MLGPSQEKAHSAYRAIDVGVAIIPSVSVVVPAKNEAPSLEHLFGTILAWLADVRGDGQPTDEPWRSLRSRTLQLTSSTTGAVKRGMPFRQDSRQPRAK